MQVAAGVAETVVTIPLQISVRLGTPQAAAGPVGVGGLEKITLELLREYPPERGFVISSFLPEVLVALRRGDEHVPIGLICETRDQLRRWKELPTQYVIPHHKLATQALVRELKQAGKKVLVWTVNGRERMNRFHKLGVDGIISDNTALLGKPSKRSR